MKMVVIGESNGATMQAIMAVYPRHKALVDAAIARGEVIGIGPFTDRGNMAIFRTREAAEASAPGRMGSGDADLSSPPTAPMVPADPTAPVAP